MTIKMIVVDMDGTFLNEQNTYDQARFMALYARLQKARIRFVVASGSQYQRLQNQFAAVKDELDFISQNGALVHHGHELLQVSALNDDDLQQTLQLIQQDFPTNMIVQRTISGVRKTYIERQVPAATLTTIQRYYHALEPVDDFFHLSATKIDDQITKIGLTFAPQVNFPAAVQHLRAMLPPTLMSQNSGLNTELIGNTGIDKVTGISELQARYNIAADEIMTFGDNENDLAMLQMTPYGFAMKNAAAAFRQQAPQITIADNDHAGVLATIESLL